ncbi:MAG: spore coat protein [Syntrophomonadaceae bacterium]|jgi:spore coat protein CotF
MQHMTDKEMVNDVLSMMKGSLSTYANIISETSNQQLRQILQQTRNSDEQFHYQLFQVATNKGFYKPATQADTKDIQQVKSSIS